MIFLLFIAFISGLLTILAPCIWPLLPVILASTATGGKRKPLGITLGVMLSFGFFTLALSYIAKLFPFGPELFRIIAVVVLLLLGVSLLIPKLTSLLEKYVSQLSGKLRINNGGTGFRSGLVTGLALGIVWTPCAGPILATIAALAVTASVTWQIVLVTVVYVIGIGIPLFLFATLGQRLFSKTRFVSQYTGRIQQLAGVILILTAVLIFTNADKTLQAKLLDKIPAYSNFIYKLEGSASKQFDEVRGNQPGLPMQDPRSLRNLGRAPEFVGIANWLNTDKPLTMADLKGKVVLVDFWTYTCINCIRTLPYITKWDETYRDKGLVIVGVHTPEFEIEKDTGNVLDAIKRFGIKYPVAQDNDYATWNAYNNRYWPAKYLIDARGNIRYFHFGEGDYEETEKAIQDLLREAGSQVDNSITAKDSSDFSISQTPETYININRYANFASTPRPAQGVRTYSIPNPLTQDQWGLIGNWNMQPEFSTSASNSVLEMRFFADKVFLVISPTSANDIVTVMLDSKPVTTDNAGTDVVNGKVQFDMTRLYNLIDLKGNPGEHLLRLEFKTPNTEVYAFTFG